MNSSLRKLLFVIVLFLTARLLFGFLHTFLVKTQSADICYHTIGRWLSKTVPGGHVRDTAFYQLNEYPVSGIREFEPDVVIPLGKTWAQCVRFAVWDAVDSGSGLVISVCFLLVAFVGNLVLHACADRRVRSKWPIIFLQQCNLVIQSAGRGFFVATAVMLVLYVSQFSWSSAFRQVSTAHIKLLMQESVDNDLMGLVFPIWIECSKRSMYTMLVLLALSGCIFWFVWERQIVKKLANKTWYELSSLDRGCGVCGYSTTKFPCPECGNFNSATLCAFSSISFRFPVFAVFFGNTLLCIFASVLAVCGAIAPFIWGCLRVLTQ